MGEDKGNGRTNESLTMLLTGYAFNALSSRIRVVTLKPNHAHTVVLAKIGSTYISTAHSHRL